MKLSVAAVIALCVAIPAGGAPVIIEGVEGYQYNDAMFEGVRIALTCRGEPFSAAYIQGISGMAFRLAGPCPCAPTCSLAMSPDELIAVLGYEVDWLCLGISDGKLDRPVAEVIERVKDQVRAGRPVPVWHAFTFAEWDLVCGFDDETEEFLGVCTYGGNADEYKRAAQTRMQEAVSICSAYGALIIGEKTGEFDAREAELAAIEEAIRHAYAPRDPFLQHIADRQIPWRFREGLACYDCWARKFRVMTDIVPDGPGDRYPMGVYSSTRGAAGPFLREIAPRYPEAQAELLRAAEHFDADAGALQTIREEALGWNVEWKGPDPARAARVAELLSQARDAYAAGISALESALGHIDPARVERAHCRAVVEIGEDSARIRGIRPLQWQTNRDCTFIGALHEVLRNTDSMYTYTDLMGLSGLAFRFRYSNAETKTQWCHSCAVGEMPDEQALLAAQTGWSLPTEWLEPDGRDNDALAARIASEIDAGRGVLTYAGTYNVALVYGYEDRGKTAIVDDYMDTRSPVLTGMDISKSMDVPVEELGPLFTYLGPQSDPPHPRDALRKALEVTVANWRREKHDGGVKGREYLYGEVALKAWIADLQAFDGLSVEDRQGLSALDPWVYTQMWDARKAAAQFLNDWACVTDGAAHDALGRAEAFYRQEVEALEPLLAAKREAVGGQDEVAEWPAADREAEIAALTRALGFERDAITELEQALAAW